MESVATGEVDQGNHLSSWREGEGKLFEYGNERLLISILGTFANCERDICIRYFTRITTGVDVNSTGVDPLIGFPVFLSFLSFYLGIVTHTGEKSYLFSEPSVGCTGNKWNFNSRDSLFECYRISSCCPPLGL